MFSQYLYCELTALYMKFFLGRNLVSRPRTLDPLTSGPANLLGLADRTAHSRRSVQKLWRVHLAMLIYRDRWVKVKIINVPVRVNGPFMHGGTFCPASQISADISTSKCWKI